MLQMISLNVWCVFMWVHMWTNSPDDKSTRLFVVAFVTLIWTATLLSSREISSVPSSRLLKKRSPSGFHVRNWKLTDIVLWLARPGSCRKLVALKKTGKVWVSTQEKDRLRCQVRERKRRRQREIIGSYQLIFKEKSQKQSQSLLNVGLFVKLFICFKCPNTLGNHVFILLIYSRLPSDASDWS